MNFDLLYVAMQVLAVTVTFVYGLTLVCDWICSPYSDGKIRGESEEQS